MFSMSMHSVQNASYINQLDYLHTYLFIQILDQKSCNEVQPLTVSNTGVSLDISWEYISEDL